MSHISWTLGQAKRLMVIIGGLTVLGIGIAMIVLPGPAIIVIPIGLAILATEFIWARVLLHKIKERIPERGQKLIDSWMVQYLPDFISRRIAKQSPSLESEGQLRANPGSA